MQLRPYQKSALDAVTRHLSTRSDNPCVELPTGSGKTPLMAALCKHYCTAWPSTRIIVLAHVKELVSQNAEKLRSMWPEGSVGVYSAGLRSRDTDAQVTFASIQSVWKRPLAFGFKDLVLVDEAHHIPTKSEGTYRSFIDGLKRNSPHLRVIGFTATPYRMDSGPVVGAGLVLNDICYRADVAELIEQGYLCRPVTKAGQARADIASVRIVAGDYARGMLEAACNKDSIVRAACAELVKLSDGRNAGIIFTAGKDHARNVSDTLLAEHGIEAPVVTDDTPAALRARIVADFKSGKYRWLVNVNVFSEGFDAPHVDVVVMLRPTKSPGLYYQQVGRGFRLHPGKRDFLVLDFAGNVIEHGPIDRIVVRKKGKGKGDSQQGPLVKECVKCHRLNPIATRQCEECGHEFPVNDDPKHSITANGAAILAADAAITHEVTRWELSCFEKPGKPRSLRVSYFVGLTRVNEWHGFEYGGVQRLKAIRWWERFGGKQPYPRDVEEAITRSSELIRPSHVKVLMSGKYPEVMGYEWQSEGVHAEEHESEVLLEL